MATPQVFDAVTIAFTGGGAVGWLLRQSWLSAEHLHQQDLAREQRQRDAAEIKRLRAFMAEHVGT